MIRHSSVALAVARAHTPGVEDFRIKTLRSLIVQVIQLQESATQLIADINEQLQQFETVRAGERLADTGELAVEAIFEITMGVGSHKSSNK